MSSALLAEARALCSRLGAWRDRPLTFMEVCGTHTMAVAKSGLRTLLPETLRLVSGPGCPVCVTPVGYVDHALALAALSDVVVVTFGDMMRVPGSAGSSLLRARAAGADVRVVYSPREALTLAHAQKQKQIVFLSVGFETTTPGVAATLLEARREGVGNLSALTANKTIPEALSTLAASAELRLDGLLCPGHVSVVLGPEVYQPIAARFGIPCAIAGFEAVEILRGLAALVDQVAGGVARVDNCYPAAVRPGGNPKARQLLDEVFEPCDADWRGLGVIPRSGLRLREAFAHLDAARRFEVELPEPVEPRGCRCGEVLRGAVAPDECPLFAGACTPEQPIGACMVSSEGSCAAAFAHASEDLA